MDIQPISSAPLTWADTAKFLLVGVCALVLGAGSAVVISPGSKNPKNETATPTDTSHGATLRASLETRSR